MKTRINYTSWKSVTLAITTSLVIGGVASAGSSPTPTPPPVMVSLPIATFDTSVPIGTVIIEPVASSNIDASRNYVGFQGDFTFDQTVVSFSSPPLQKAGLTGGYWNVSGSVLTAA